MFTRVTLSLLLLAACDDGGTDTDIDPGTDTGSLPDFVTCEGTVCRITGTVAEDFTLDADTTWLLDGPVFVGDDGDACPTLTVDAGTIVYGASGKRSFLTVQRCARIEAVGTADSPVVFTSAADDGERAAGDWGGLILNGRAPVNLCQDMARCDVEGEGNTGRYGGNDPADSSGTLKYVRVEFAGDQVSDDNQLNGIAFQGVGSGTTVDYVQVHHNADDGVEFFGGTVNVSHLVLTGIADDSIDWTFGWTGTLTYAVAQQWPGQGDNGIEADNNEDDNAAEPRSKPTIKHMTLIGSPESDKSDLGMLLRRGTAVNISDSIIGGFNDTCVVIDGAETYSNAWDTDKLSGELTLTDSFVGDCTALYGDKDNQGFTTKEWVETLNSGNTVIEDLSAVVEDPFNTAAPDFTSKGAAASAGAVTGDDWTKGWTTSAAN